MAKGGKQAAWKETVRGTLIAVGAYALGAALLAFLIVKGAVPEKGAFPVLTVWCALSVLCGGGAVRKGTARPMPGALTVAGCFCGIWLLVTLTVFRNFSWNGHGGILMAAALAGGICAGLLAAGRKGRKKRK